MIDFSDPYGVRTYNRKKVLENEQDKDARAHRLSPVVVEGWSKLIKIVAPIVATGNRPCDYGPWEGALREYSRVPPYVGALPANPDKLAIDFARFSGDVAQPSWPEPRQDLIEFSLAYLEADVMLFRSGYTKKNLLRRLQQSVLNRTQISRVSDLLKRAVLNGTGVDEHRSFRKLAAHLYATGHLIELHEWLEEKAAGAILTWERGLTAMDIIKNPALAEESKMQLLKPSRWWGVLYPGKSEVVVAGNLHKHRDQKIKVSAYRILAAMDRRSDAN